MRSAWRLSLSKFDVHPQHSGPRSGAGVLLKLICLCLLSIALYPAPGWLGYPVPKAPEALQIFIDRITTPYFRFFAIAILITMLLKDSTIAWFRLKDGYKQAITTIKLKIAPGLFAVLFLYGGFALASHYIFNVRDSFGALLPARPQGERTRHLPAERTGPVQARIPAATFRATCTAACRGIETEFDTRNSCTSARLKVERRQRLQIRDQQEGRMVISRRAVGPGRNAAQRILAS